MATMVYGFDIETADGRLAAQAIEYGTYIAAVAIYIAGEVLAYNIADRVPVTDAIANGYVASGWLTQVGPNPPA